jgi:hypothetical protein
LEKGKDITSGRGFKPQKPGKRQRADKGRSYLSFARLMIVTKIAINSSTHRILDEGKKVCLAHFFVLPFAFLLLPSIGKPKNKSCYGSCI